MSDIYERVAKLEATLEGFRCTVCYGYGTVMERELLSVYEVTCNNCAGSGVVGSLRGLHARLVSLERNLSKLVSAEVQRQLPRSRQ
jgi:hypothetical protein